MNAKFRVDMLSVGLDGCRRNVKKLSYAGCTVPLRKKKEDVLLLEVRPCRAAISKARSFRGSASLRAAVSTKGLELTRVLSALLEPKAARSRDRANNVTITRRAVRTPWSRVDR